MSRCILVLALLLACQEFSYGQVIPSRYKTPSKEWVEKGEFTPAFNNVGFSQIQASNEPSTLGLDEITKGLEKAVRFTPDLEFSLSINTVSIASTDHMPKVDIPARIKTVSELQAKLSGSLYDTQYQASKEVSPHRYWFDGKVGKSLLVASKEGSIHASRTPVAGIVNRFFSAADRYAGDSQDYSNDMSSPIRLLTLLKQPPSDLPEEYVKQLEYKVRRSLEIIDGNKCHVIESAADIAWIDTGNGFVVRRRLSLGPTNDGWIPARLCERDSYITGPDGFQLPRKVGEYLFSGNGDFQNNWGQVDSRVVFQVDEVSFDPINAQTFVRDFPEGTRVLDEIGKRVYHQPGDITELNQAIENGATIDDKGDIIGDIGMGVSLGELADLDGDSSSLLRKAFIFLNIIFVLVLAGILVRRRIMQRK